MSASSPREAELRALHEAVIAERNTCLEEMDTRDGLPEGHSQLSEAAHSRNQALLRDLREAEKSFKRSSNLGPNRNIVKLENRYWRSVEQELPKWEQFLLGKSQLPFGMKENSQKLKHSQTMQTPKRTTLPPSGYSSKTLPR
ncbi:centrosomal protein 15 isoform X1 [Engystomops pustulosus]|uniref:centrosomal protein 15 isoform X1 n=2 Tax=Engystomops pustulosus TaxID=76066 RepID=UPI003AFA680B